METPDYRIVISGAARNLCHSQPKTHAFFPPMCRAFLRFPHLSFMPTVPYPPLWGTFPSRGRLAIRGKPAIANLWASPHIYSRRSRHLHSSLLTPNSSLVIRAEISSPIKRQHAPLATPEPSKKGSPRHERILFTLTYFFTSGSFSKFVSANHLS